MVDKGCFSFCFYIYSHGRGIIIQQMALEHCRHLRHVFYAFMCRYSCSPRREPSICRIIATSMTFGQNKKWSFFCKYVKCSPRREPSICRIIATSMTFGQNKKWSFFCKYVKNSCRKHEKIVIFCGYFSLSSV